jgi:hypothetical protein
MPRHLSGRGQAHAYEVVGEINRKQKIAMRERREWDVASCGGTHL